MIHPRMATTLAFVLTDALYYKESARRGSERSLREKLQSDHRRWRHLDQRHARGHSQRGLGAPVIEHKDDSYQEFLNGLTQVCQSLAQQIVRDGEGASKFVEIVVEGAESEESAAQIGRSIANSPLVKTALAGEDANWGRILCAAGYSGVPFDPDRVEIKIGDLPVCKRGQGHFLRRRRCQTDPQTAGHSYCAEPAFGSSTATLWTCDLTKEYIHINADYRT